MKKCIFILIVFCSFIARSQSFVEGDSLIISGGGTFGAQVQGVEATDSSSFVILGQIADFVGIDSIAWDTLTGDFTYYNSGILIDTKNLDGRYAIGSFDEYVPYVDSTIKYVTPDQLNDSLNVVDSVIEAKFTHIYTISLPNAGTVLSRISSAVAGVDYPAEWTLTVGASSVDLNIEHNLDKYVASVTIFSNPSGTQRQQLFNSAAYNGIICDDSNNLRIQSLSTVPTKLYIYIVFQQ